MLTEVIPAHSRAKVYAIYATLGLIIGAVQVAYSAADAGQPVWLTVTLAVYAFLGGAVGYTARANTPSREPGLGE